MTADVLSIKFSPNLGGTRLTVRVRTKARHQSKAGDSLPLASTGLFEFSAALMVTGSKADQWLQGEMADNLAKEKSRKQRELSPSDLY